MSLERAMLFKGVGDEPAVQDAIPAMYWEKYGLQVDLVSMGWQRADYERKLKVIGGKIERLAEEDVDVYVIGVSGGGKTALSILAIHLDSVRKAATVCTKEGPYEYDNPHTATRLPNLELSSEFLRADLETMDATTRQRILCMYPQEDERVKPEEQVVQGSKEYAIDANDHISGIVMALTCYSDVIVDHFRAA